MHQTISNKINFATQFLIIVLLMISCFVIDYSLFNGIVYAKEIWIQAVSVFILGYLIIYIFNIKVININIIDLLVFTLFLWMVGIDFFNMEPYRNSKSHIINIITYFILYLFFRLLGKDIRRLYGIIAMYLMVIVAQVIIGLLQLYGIINSYHTLFPITGTFHNPGPFAGFIVIGLPIALTLFFITKSYGENKHNIGQISYINEPFTIRKWCIGKRVNGNKVLKFLAQFVIVMLLLTLPATKSRAAWLGAIVGCLFVIWKFKDYKVIRQCFPIKLKIGFNKNLQRLAIATLILFIVFVVIGGFYKFKQGSADGRLLIWQVSFEMIKDKPLLGWGQGGFDANYANYQADWFKSGKGTAAQKMMAGMPETPFNEVLRIAINYGLTGMFIVSIIGLILFGGRSGKGGILEKIPSLKHSRILFQSGLISIFIFSLFSYPFDVPSIRSQMLLLLVLLVNFSSNIYTVKIPILRLGKKKLIPFFLFVNFKIGVAVFAFIVGLAIYRTNMSKYIGLREWNESYLYYQYMAYDASVESYNEANLHIPKNGLLLQMYGKCLAIKKEYYTAIKVLLEAKRFYSSSIIEITLGQCYEALGENDMAESAFIQAINMEPVKFYPLYLLTKLYYDTDQKEKAFEFWEKIKYKQIKIPSMAIRQMKDELNQLFEK